MSKLQQPTGILNEGDQLRAHLAECERALASLDAQRAQALLRNAAEAHRLLDKLRAAGADVRAEAARWQTVTERMVKDAERIVNAAGGTRSFVALRSQVAPQLDEPWWALEAIVAARRRRLIRQAIAGFAILAAIGLVGFLLRDVLFPPNPVGDAIFAAQSALQQGDVSRALQAIEEGLQAAPNHPTLLTWKGTLLDARNDPAATAILAAARAGMGERDYLLERSQVNLLLGRYERVVADMTYAIERFADPADAYMMRATALEQQGNLPRAIRDLEAAAAIAERIGNDALFATARVRMGMLLQVAPALSLTPAP